MSKKISIIIPCYNTEQYIDRCLTSLINQTIGLEHLSIICVNDASTDHTWEKLESWRKRFPNNIILINAIQNGRQGTARNIAFPYVTTPYVAYLDSDDWLEPDMYEKMYHLLFRAVTDAMDLLEEQKYQEALSLLERASRDAEEVYMSE